MSFLTTCWNKWYDMGCQIHGFIAVVAHTHVFQEARSSRIALIIVRPGKKNKEVTEAFQKISAAYDCEIVEGVLSHQLKQFVIDGNKAVFRVPGPETRVGDAEFRENEVYATDMVASIEKARGFCSFSYGRITSHALQEVQPTKTLDEEPEIQAWLALATKSKT